MHWILQISILLFLIPTDEIYQKGKASYYAQWMNGHRTASGDYYRSDSLTAAHARLPFGTRVLVRNLKNDSTVILRINDRMVYSQTRIIDVSMAAAKKLNFVREGLANVEIKILDTIVKKR